MTAASEQKWELRLQLRIADYDEKSGWPVNCVSQASAALGADRSGLHQWST
jgi:hypothetical protein